MCKLFSGLDKLLSFFCQRLLVIFVWASGLVAVFPTPAHSRHPSLPGGEFLDSNVKIRLEYAVTIKWVL